MTTQREEIQKLGDMLADSIVKDLNDILEKKLNTTFDVTSEVVLKSNLEFQIEISVEGIQSYLSPVFNIFSTVKEDERKSIIDNIEDWTKSFARFIAYDVEKCVTNGAVNGC